MAGRAGDAAVGRETLVVKQPFAERALFRRIRIGRWKRNTGGPAELILQAAKIVALRQRRRPSGERAASQPAETTHSFFGQALRGLP